MRKLSFLFAEVLAACQMLKNILHLLTFASSTIFEPYRELYHIFDLYIEILKIWTQNQPKKGPRSSHFIQWDTNLTVLHKGKQIPDRTCWMLTTESRGEALFQIQEVLHLSLFLLPKVGSWVWFLLLWKAIVSFWQWGDIIEKTSDERNTGHLLWAWTPPGRFQKKREDWCMITCLIYFTSQKTSAVTEPIYSDLALSVRQTKGRRPAMKPPPVQPLMESQWTCGSRSGLGLETAPPLH